MASDQEKLAVPRNATTIPAHCEQNEGGRKQRKRKKERRRRKRDDEKSFASALATQESTTASRLSSSAGSSSTSVVGNSPKTADSSTSAPRSGLISSDLAWLRPKERADVNVSPSLQRNSATDKATTREPSEPAALSRREELHSEPFLGGATPLGSAQGQNKSRSSSRTWGGSLFDLSPSTKMEETPLLIGSHSSMPELFGRWAASPSAEPRDSGANTGVPAGALCPTRQSLSAPVASIPPQNAERRGADGKVNRVLSICYLSPIQDAMKLPSATVAEPVVGINRIKAAVVVVGFGLFWVLFLVVLLFLWEHHVIAHRRDLLCGTEDCARHAKLLADIVSTSNVNPCDDFTAYVCSAISPGGFPSNGNHYENAMDAAIYNWYSRLDETLHVALTTARIARKPLEMFESCLGNSHLESDPSEFLRFVNETELSWPEEPGKSVDALSAYVSRAFYYDAPAWFSITIRESSNNRSFWRLVVSPSPYLPEMLERHESVFRSGSYGAYCRDVLRAIVGDNVERLGWDDELINETGAMEHVVLWNLYGAMAVGGPRATSVLTSIEHLGNYTPSVSGLSWLTALKRNLPLQPTMATEVYLTDVEYMRTVGELFAKYDDRQLVRHLSWLFLQRYAPVVNVSVLTDRYEDAESAARRSFCGSNVEESYDLLIAVLFFVSRVSRHDKTSIDATFDSLTASASGLVTKSSWLDAQSKSMAAEKLREVKMSIWPSKVLLNTQVLESFYSDFPERLDSFTGYWTETRRKLREAKQRAFYRQFWNEPMSAAEPYLTYDAIENRVLVAMGAIARPLYYSNGTRGMLYGGIGFLMTLEMVRSLDANGLRWHPNGSFVHSMLTDESTEKFEARDSCIGKNESAFPEVPALEVTYSALQEALARDRRRLMVAENLTEEMVFFLTLCLMTCRRKHTVNIASADCNKAVRNFAPFATAFSCPVGSSMNPRVKCEFFG